MSILWYVLLFANVVFAMWNIHFVMEEHDTANAIAAGVHILAIIVLLATANMWE